VTYDHTQLSGVALDLETGGLDPDTCALLRVGVVVVVHGRVAALCDWRVQPGGGLDLDPEALAVNRWEPRPNDSLEYEVLERLSGMVAGLPTDTQLLTFGHNVRWDLAVLRAVARRHGCSAPDLPHRLADSSVLALPLLLAAPRALLLLVEVRQPGRAGRQAVLVERPAGEVGGEMSGRAHRRTGGRRE